MEKGLSFSSLLEKRLFQIAISSHRCLATNDNQRYSTDQITNKSSFRSNLPPFISKREQAELNLIVNMEQEGCLSSNRC